MKNRIKALDIDENISLTCERYLLSKDKLQVEVMTNLDAIIPR